MGLLLLNAGSSSLKFSFMDRDGRRVWAQGGTDSASRPARYAWQGESGSHSETVSWSRLDEAVRRVVADVRSVAASVSAGASIDVVAHRVVHGGARFTEPAQVTPEVRAALSELTPLAPLHNPSSLEVIDAALAELPDVPHVAVFDTAFHATMSPEAFTYPLPAEWTRRWGLRRFGFHGLSHAYSSGRAAEMLGRTPQGLRLVIAHLGHGASVTAVQDGQSVDTSMGFTPLEGLMMGTRSGSVDPGLLLHLQLQRGISAEELDRVLNHESGLLGVSGVSADMRRVIEAARGGDDRASLALAMFAHRARQAIAALAVTVGGVDALVFTGGIGENSQDVRAAICDGLGCLGLELDASLNESVRPDGFLSAASSRGRILVVQAREDVMMARAAMACLETARSVTSSTAPSMCVGRVVSG